MPQIKLMQHHKLVRDQIPDLIAKKGQTPIFRRLSSDEYLVELRHKLHEEVTEFEQSGEPSELADILEVIYALAAVGGVSQAALEELRLQKRAERGGFEERCFLIETIA